MFDFAWSHILLLLLVAVIFLGPKELPVVLRYLGKIFAKFRQHREELQEYVEAAISHTENHTDEREKSAQTPVSSPMPAPSLPSPAGSHDSHQQ